MLLIWHKKTTALILAFIIAAASLFSFPHSIYAETPPSSETDGEALSAGAVSQQDDYKVYTENNAGLSSGSDTVEYESAEGALTGNEDGKTGIELSSEQREIIYTFNIDSPGLYNIEIDYYAMPGRMKDIVFSLAIDGETPFEEAESITLSRVYTDSGDIEQDSNGNDLRPSQVEAPRWNVTRLTGNDGYYDDPYLFAFKTAGQHTVTLTYFEEAMLVGKLSLVPEKELPSYSEYAQGASPANKYIELFEAEDSFEKSSSMLYPTYDRSSAATSPSHYSKMRYNTIGQSNWAQQGQWISWKITVPEDGWYSLSFRARQNYQQGINSYRTLYIDGEVPFAEAAEIEFPYALGWYMKTLADSDGEPYLFYLERGVHELKLEVPAGPMGEVLKSLSDSVLELNSIYRSIIMVTGVTPDQYRTYYLEESIPELFDRLESVSSELDAIYEKITEITGASGSQASTIKEMSVMLGEFIDRPLNIPNRISAFKTNIESLGSLILTLSSQPLELDYIAVYSESELPQVNAGFFEGLSYAVKGFIASFTEDYNTVGSSADGSGVNKNITVWISNGRDQAQILKNLIDNNFTPDTKIGVTLSVVSTATGTSSSTLVQATLAGKGPDVSLFTPKDTPVNLAMRGALADLKELDGFDELYDEFYPSAWIPYEYEGGVYGVPETQNYEMLFYRTDIFQELGLSVPQTWEEFYAVTEILQKNNLGVGVLETNTANAGISSGISFFEKLLLQNGGTYYTDDLSQTRFDEEAAYSAFESWTELYTDYGLDRSFDFFNRFRTGEMPMGIMSYVTYNQLYSAAPEIRGLWAMTMVPGTLKEDGTIDRTETATSTAAIILADCDDIDSAWEFVKWWVGSEAQSSYGTELEASLGVAARYDTANIEAFDSIGWTESEAEVLKAQWAEVTDIQQIPGNYFISRCLTNAFRSVVDDNVNPVRALNTYNKDMNAEIERKRAEFGLE